MRTAALFLFCVFLLACSVETTKKTGKQSGVPAATSPTFHAEQNPDRLSAWGMLAQSDNALRLSAGVLPYDLATPLFSDYALKLRTVWMQDGTAADYRSDTVFDFPVGTVITKTFYYPTDDQGRVLQASGPVLSNTSLPINTCLLYTSPSPRDS